MSGSIRTGLHPTGGITALMDGPIITIPGTGGIPGHTGTVGIGPFRTIRGITEGTTIRTGRIIPAITLRNPPSGGRLNAGWLTAMIAMPRLPFR
jgi:hypothetical protein